MDLSGMTFSSGRIASNRSNFASTSASLRPIAGDERMPPLAIALTRLSIWSLRSAIRPTSGLVCLLAINAFRYWRSSASKYLSMANC